MFAVVKCQDNKTLKVNHPTATHYSREDYQELIQVGNSLNFLRSCLSRTMLIILIARPSDTSDVAMPGELGVFGNVHVTAIFNTDLRKL